jgi:hypothetical protein
VLTLPAKGTIQCVLGIVVSARFAHSTHPVSGWMPSY